MSAETQKNLSENIHKVVKILGSSLSDGVDTLVDNMFAVLSEDSERERGRMPRINQREREDFS